MKIGIANDHAGVDLKYEIKEYLEEKGYEVINYGTDEKESVNYPTYGKRLAHGILDGMCDCGIAICGTGIGISLAANKVRGIRAAVCSEPYSARLSKEHNNCQILAFGARVVGPDLAKMMVDEWLNAEFLGNRHETRVEMIECKEDF